MKFRRTAVLSLFVLVFALTHLNAASLWSYKSPQKVQWHKVMYVGTVVMGTDDAITSLDGETGKIAWKRDFKKVSEFQVEEIAGTPLLFVSEKTQGGTVKLNALDLLTGETLWESDKLKGFTVGILPVYEKDMVLLLTIPNEYSNKEKPDMIAFEMSTGKLLWESEFANKVDLHGVEGKYRVKHDLSGHQEPIYEGDAVYFPYAGLHKYDLNTGKLIWAVPYDVTEGQIKKGNAQTVIDGDVVYTSAKGQLRAIDKNTGAVKWTSKDFGGAIAEMVVKGDRVFGRLGGTFYNYYSKQWELKKPLGVVAVNKANGSQLWKFDDADDSITNMGVVDEENTILIADHSNLIGLDMNATGSPRVAYKVKLEFKNKLGAAGVAMKVAKFGFGGLQAGLKKDKSREDPPVAIHMREQGLAVVRGRNHILAFNPKTKQIAWSTQFAAPGFNGWQKFAMMAAYATAYGMNTSVSSRTQYGTSANDAANAGRQSAIAGFDRAMQKRYTAANASERHAYVLTNLEEGKEKGAGVVGINLDTGAPEHQVMFKDKEPDYVVDDISGILFNLKNETELTAFSTR